MLSNPVFPNAHFKTLASLLDGIVLQTLRPNVVLHVGDLNATLDQIFVPQLFLGENFKEIFSHYTLREFLTTTFDILGIIIAFSGKLDGEKAVVIDLDTDIICTFGIEKEHFKFGQTMIRVEKQYFNNLTDIKNNINTNRLVFFLEQVSTYLRVQIRLQNPINFI